VALTVAGWSQLAAGSDPGARLFAEGAFHDIRLDISAAGLETLRGNPREDVKADVRLGRDRYSQVAVHLKGSSGSFRPITDKPAMTLSFSDGQRCDGLRKIHLNNSVEDPSYLHERLGAEWFRAAGLPVARVAHARVHLNGRSLGLYVVKEGFTTEFLGEHFRRADGNLYEPVSGNDVDGRMELRVAGNSTPEQSGLVRLAAAAAESDLACRWSRLDAVLDTDRFLSFMALEVMLGHRDGYGLARNNFRIYHDPSADKLVFLPHGMDQLLGTPDLAWQPHWAGLVARAVMETSEGRQRYRERFVVLFDQVFVVDQCQRRVDDWVAALRPFLGTGESKALEREATGLKARLAQRADSLRRQLAEPERSRPEFVDQRAALGEWQAVDAFSAREMDHTRDAEGRSVLRIAAGSTTSASWRTKALLPRGLYQFQGRVKVSGVRPLPFGRSHGACLRLTGGQTVENRLLGESPWCDLTVPFAVAETEATLEFACELRASAGQAWFDADSLAVVRVAEGQSERVGGPTGPERVFP